MVYLVVDFDRSRDILSFVPVGYFTKNMHITPLHALKITQRQIPTFERIPNTSVGFKPLLIYHSAFEGTASEISSHLSKIGVVEPQWTYTMYSTSHFHSTVHEVLSVISGRARLCFGFENNPGKFEPTVSKGDVIIVPAGVAHRLIEDLDGNFKMVGSYPLGTNWDMCYGSPGETDKSQTIKGLDWFRKDPIYGNEGPALNV